MKTINHHAFHKLKLYLCVFALLLGSITSATVFADSAMGKASTYAGTIKSDGFNLNFRIEGTGKPVISVGFPNLYARTFSQELRSHLRLVFVDHRGSASTLRNNVDVPTEYSLGKSVDDIELVRSKLGLGKVAVLGHGGQAWIALEYAIKYPDNVSHLIMVSPPYSEVSREKRLSRFYETASDERKALQAENDKKLTDEYLASLASDYDRSVAVFVSQGPMMFYDKHFDTSPFWKWVDYDEKYIAHLWDDGGAFSKIKLSERLPLVKVPVAVIEGPYDFKAPPEEYWNGLLKRFDHLNHIMIEKTGHFPQYENSKAFDKKLLKWMG